MSSKNDITGDKIQTKGILSKEGEENFDRIFRKKKLIIDDAHNLQIETDEDDIDAKRLTDAFNGL
jgi:hypothetical protein